MRRKRQPMTLYPTDLFAPPPTRPTWDRLPPAVTRHVTELLVDLLREHLAPPPRPTPPSETEHD
jgi:hypothetical protein